MRSTLRISPTAMAKMRWMCHRGLEEIGAVGISAEDDLLFIEDVVLPEQTVTSVGVEFSGQAWLGYIERMLAEGLPMERIARVWMHTHPGDSPEPSGTDEDTFQRSFGECDWAVMFILARGGRMYCRLRFNVGPGGEMEIPVTIDDSRPFAGSDEAGWEAEYQLRVTPETFGGGMQGVFGEAEKLGTELVKDDGGAVDDWLAEYMEGAVEYEELVTLGDSDAG